jgi:hypothetical protein
MVVDGGGWGLARLTGGGRTGMRAVWRADGEWGIAGVEGEGVLLELKGKGRRRSRVARGRREAWCNGGCEMEMR